MVLDYKTLFQLVQRIAKDGKIDEDWTLCDRNDFHGEFCCFCTAIRRCVCEKHDEESTNLLVADPEVPCEQCVP